jgi:cell fate (sporulation/competence/biofilm development) regulator YmcA (YheA/YmcA/DUF963 family)/predicted RNA-binding Zn-ribbon protein involved in translation (DUF1610 family)
MELLNKFAEDNNGKIIHIKNALSGVDYYCPECKEKFILKKGDIRQHHFAHNNSSSSCTGTGEGYLHKAFKKMLLENIKNNLNNKSPIIINWICNVCNMQHNGDLLNDIIDAKDEYNLVECRPDIALIHKNGNVPIIIEIVHKHEPEENVIDYCRKHNTVLIRIKLDSIDDLEKIENKIKSPSNVIFFYLMNCPNYRNYLLQRQQSNSQTIPRHNAIRQSGPRIDQVVAEHERNRQKQHFAIQNYYKKKSIRK